jgi:nucleoside 2-deoxyribosyltransferase
VGTLAFCAYPSGFQIIKDAVAGVVERSAVTGMSIKPWEKLRTIGLKIDDLIRDEIKSADLLIAEVTYPNFNVFYEIGFAAALGKPVVPVVNVAVDKSTKRINDLGLFDTIGWATYTNAEELRDKLVQWNDVA